MFKNKKTKTPMERVRDHLKIACNSSTPTAEQTTALETARRIFSLHHKSSGISPYTTSAFLRETLNTLNKLEKDQDDVDYSGIQELIADI